MIFMIASRKYIFSSGTEKPPTNLTLPEWNA